MGGVGEANRQKRHGQPTNDFYWWTLIQQMTLDFKYKFSFIRQMKLLRLSIAATILNSD
jgi:hypothetical protein